MLAKHICVLCEYEHDKRECNWFADFYSVHFSIFSKVQEHVSCHPIKENVVSKRHQV